MQEPHPKSGFSYSTSAPSLSLWTVLQFISVDPVSQYMSQAWGHLRIRAEYVTHYLLHQVVLLSRGIPGLPFLLRRDSFFMGMLQTDQSGESPGQLGLGFHWNKGAEVIRFNLVTYFTLLPYSFFSIEALLLWYCHSKSKFAVYIRILRSFDTSWSQSMDFTVVDHLAQLMWFTFSVHWLWKLWRSPTSLAPQNRGCQYISHTIPPEKGRSISASLPPRLLDTDPKNKWIIFCRRNKWDTSHPKITSDWQDRTQGRNRSLHVYQHMSNWGGFHFNSPVPHSSQCQASYCSSLSLLPLSKATKPSRLRVLIAGFRGLTFCSWETCFSFWARDTWDPWTSLKNGKAVSITQSHYSHLWKIKTVFVKIIKALKCLGEETKSFHEYGSFDVLYGLTDGIEDLTY